MKKLSVYFSTLLFFIGLITIYSPSTEAGSTGINIKKYCQSQHPGFWGDKATATKVGRNKNAFSWRCVQYNSGYYWPKTYKKINMNNACKWQTGKSWAKAYLKDGKTHSYSWRCKY